MGNNNVEGFRHLLQTEKTHLTDLCSKWKHISDVTSIPEEARGHIRTTIGQAQLLMSQRFNQFESLLDDCEFHRGAKTVTCDDLQGFWDMVYFQVEDVNNRFAMLDELQKNRWIPEKQGPYMSPSKRARQKKETKFSTTTPGKLNKGTPDSFRSRGTAVRKQPEMGHSEFDSSCHYTNGTRAKT